MTGIETSLTPAEVVSSVGAPAHALAALIALQLEDAGFEVTLTPDSALVDVRADGPLGLQFVVGVTLVGS